MGHSRGRTGQLTAGPRGTVPEPRDPRAGLPAVESGGPSAERSWPDRADRRAAACEGRCRPIPTGPAQRASGAPRCRQSMSTDRLAGRIIWSAMQSGGRR
jgi:hypothetical protein